MQFPQNLQHLAGAPAAGAAYAIALTVPALGAGLRCRIWRYSGGVFTIGPGAAVYHVALGDTTTGTIYDEMTYHATTGSGERLFPGGLIHPRGANQAMSIYVAASVAVTLLVSIQFTVERV